MKLGQVAGTIVSTVCSPAYDNRKLLVCDLVDSSGKKSGDYLIAIDNVGAGVGETVLILDEGNSARQVLRWPDAPVRALTVGIVDEIEAR